MYKREKEQQVVNTEVESPLFDATIRWCLLFTENLSSLHVSPKTSCTLLGMIEWHNLTEILNDLDDAPQVKPQVSCFEEKMVLLEDGIPCSLQQLQDGDVKASLSLEFSLPHTEKKIFHSSNWSDIDRPEVVKLVRTIQKQIQSGQSSDTCVVSLASRKPKSGFFRQRSMQYKAALAMLRGVNIDNISQQVADQYVARDIVNKKNYIPFGTRTKLSLHSGSGKLVDQHISHLC